MRSIPDGAEPGPVGTHAAERGAGDARVASLLARWQADRDADDFAAIVAIVREPLARMAARTLRQVGIRDPGACDDVVARVLDRLFRLGAPGDARPPVAFDRGRGDPAAADDPGWAFVRCMAWSLARDVARAQRRRDSLVAGYAASAAPPGAAVPDDGGAEAADIELVRAAIATLDERSREVVTLLLDGKSQAVIAHVLGVCEGTVSRVRAKAIARIQAALAPQKRGS